MNLSHLTTQDEIAASFALMASLRPHLENVSAYCDLVEAQMRQGYCLLAATEGDQILGLAGYRHQQNLIYGRFTYVDDLVVHESSRGRSIGKTLLKELRHLATSQGSQRLVLDTGLANALAQRFYFRNGMLAAAMHFSEILPSAPAGSSVVDLPDATSGYHPPDTATNFDIIHDRSGTGSTKWSRYQADVLPMWLADMDFAAPPEVLKAVQTRLAHPVLGYAIPRDELRSQIVNDMKRKYDWQILPEDIVFLPGVMPGVNMALKAHLTPGDGVVVQPPVYGPMLSAPGHWNLERRLSPLFATGEGWSFDEAALEAELSRSRALLFCNPQNPTGKVFSRNELEVVSQLCHKHDILVISNESHCDLVFDGRRHVPMASLSEDAAQRTVTMMSASKAYNIAGLKTAFAIVQNNQLRIAIESSRLGMVDSVNAFGLEATLAAFAGAERWKTEMLAYLQANRDHLAETLIRRLPKVRFFRPEGTFLAWLDCSQLGLADPHAFFLKNAKVGFSAGAEFGDVYRQHVRLNFGCSRATLDTCLDRLEHAIHAHEASGVS